MSNRKIIIIEYIKIYKKTNTIIFREKLKSLLFF